METAIHAPGAGRAEWINGWRWDLGMLIGSAAIVPLVLYLVWSGADAMTLTLGVTAIIGGPHVYSTYVVVFGDARFRRSHRWLLLGATTLVPAFVIYWTLVDFQILLSVFIFAASLHVLHQNAYLTDLYRARSSVPEPRWSRYVDYGLLMLCFYPIASHRLVHSNFYLGDIEIIIPAFLKVAATYWAVWTAFSLLLAAWIVKTWSEWRRGALNRPKTCLIAATTVIGFWVPAAASGERLELAFQSVNAWHSFQYLGIVWFILAARKAKGLVTSPLVSKLSGSGRAAFYFYGTCLLITFAVFGLVVSLTRLDPLGLAYQQYYYGATLSFLLIHYVLDAYFFAVSNRPGASAVKNPYALSAAS